MAGEGQPTSLHLKENLCGRIANLAMAPSYANTLIPLFEAIMNSLHAVQDRFGDSWVKQCRIDVQVLEDGEGNPRSFTIEDNGIGLDDRNFNSFRTYDSRKKIIKGGKGIGRLTWLKVFEAVKVSSIFEERGLHLERRFRFILDNTAAFQDYSLADAEDGSDVRTFIELLNLKDGYRSHCPKKLETIAHRIAAHFLPFLIGDEKPAITISDSNESLNLAEVVAANMFTPQSKTFNVEDVGKFTIKHLLLNKALVEKETKHTVYLAAHDRIVTDHDVNNQTGLDTPITNEDDVQTYYVGIVTCDFLDKSVTQERNNFDIPKETYKTITKKAEKAAKTYLEEPIKQLIEAKAKTIDSVVTNFPRYAYLVQDRKEFAGKLPLNRKTEEDIYREMSVHDYRASRDIKNGLRELAGEKDDPAGTEDFQAKLDEFMERIGEQERASLAEYVSKRKLVIELLNSRLGYEDKAKEKLHREESIQRIICPLRVNSGDIAYGNHNLWLIDDRLAYYDFWASDQSIRSFVKVSEAKERPDLILFQGSHLLRREGTNQPIVIVEFKRPARNDYSNDKNPVKQIYDYIRELRDNKVTDNDGALITEIGADTPFFCYLVCDITHRLKALLEDYGIVQELPGGRGYFGYNNTRRAYVEVLQYSEIVHDARLRHEAFFKELGIN